MFMCVVNLKAVNKLDLTWKQSFLICGCFSILVEIVPSAFESLPGIPVVPWVRWSSEIILGSGWWMRSVVVILDPVSFARNQRWDRELWKWMSLLARCPRCIRWSISWSIYQCVSVGWAAGSPVQSGVLGLVFSVRRRLVNCSLSWIAGPLLAWAIRPGSVQWIVCVLLVGWIVSGKWTDYPWGEFGVWSFWPVPDRNCPSWWPLDARPICRYTGCDRVLELQGGIFLWFLSWSMLSSWPLVAIGIFAHKW